MKNLNENDIKMLLTIRRNPKCTKSSLASKVQLPWATAYSSITKLIAQKLITSSDAIKNTSSTKYKSEFSINRDYEYYIGISVGSSHIKLVILGFDFNIIPISVIKDINNGSFIHTMDNNNFFIPSNDNLCHWCSRTPDTIEELSKILINVCKEIIMLKQYLPIVAINFTLPGYIDFYEQKIISIAYLCSKSETIKDSHISRLITSEIYNLLIQNKISVFIDHNVKSSAVAEKESRLSSMPDNDDLIVLYLGRGIGMSMVINETLYRDKENSSGQIGEMYICTDKFSGKVEQLILKNVYSDKILPTDTASDLKKKLEEQFSEEKSVLSSIIAHALANVLHIVGIKNIIFSGKLTKILNCMEFSVLKELEELGIYGVHLHSSIYGEFSAAIGAAMSCFNNLYNIEYSWKK